VGVRNRKHASEPVRLKRDVVIAGRELKERSDANEGRHRVKDDLTRNQRARSRGTTGRRTGREILAAPALSRLERPVCVEMANSPRSTDTDSSARPGSRAVAPAGNPAPAGTGARSGTVTPPGRHISRPHLPPHST